MSQYCQICGDVRDWTSPYVVNSHRIYKCETCGVGHVRVDNFDPAEHYDAGYFEGEYKHSYLDYLGNQDVISREFSSTLEYIRSNGPRSGRLLEIGCAYGLFLEQASRYYDVYGVEIVPEAAAYCRSNGLQNVKHGTLQHEDIQNIGQIDVVVMLDVIEHIDNVEETMKMIADGLCPGGTLHITTGDWSSFAARITGKNWRLMAPPLHLWYFTPSSLSKLGERYGLRLESVSHPWKIVPLELILQQASVTLGMNHRVNMPKKLKSIGLPANMWDAMRLCFVKI